MFLKQQTTGDLVDIVDMSDLINPFHSEVLVQFQRGEDLLDPEMLDKHELVFPSGEALPRCWIDGHYRGIK